MIISEEIHAAASRWVRRRAAGLTAVEREEFQAWVAASAAHRRALAAANPEPNDCDWAWESGMFETVVAGLEQRQEKRKKRKVLVGSLLVLTFCGAVWLAWPRPVTPARTGSPLVVLGPRQEILPDGSVVQMDERADVKTEYSPTRRRIVLAAGAAHFQVRSDPIRPFFVVAGNIETRALGTAFSVNLKGDFVEVVVTEGKVAVQDSAHMAAPALSAGEMIAVPLAAPRTESPEKIAPEVAHLSAAQVAAHTSWRLPRLQFDDTPLREIVEQMNRHSERRLRIADPALGELCLSGVLRADRVERLADIVEADLPIRVERGGNEIIFWKK